MTMSTHMTKSAICQAVAIGVLRELPEPGA
jgi:hypothetical protein